MENDETALTNVPARRTRKRKVEKVKALTYQELLDLQIDSCIKNKDKNSLTMLKQQILAAKNDANTAIALCGAGIPIALLPSLYIASNMNYYNPVGVLIGGLSGILASSAVIGILVQSELKKSYKQQIDKITYSLKQ